MSSRSANRRSLDNLGQCPNLRYLELKLPESRTHHEFSSRLPAVEDLLSLPFLTSLRYLVISRNPRKYFIQLVCT